MGLLVLAFLVVLAPLIFATAVKYLPWLAPVEAHFTIARFAIASIVLIGALMITHKWLPAGRRRFAQIRIGILVTVILWLVIGVAFGRYLAEFASSYVTYYAGLASVMIALVFLYWTSCIFVYGGELNAAISRLGDAKPKAG
jgi:membrane protein